MAAVYPAGPEPMMITWRTSLAIEVLSLGRAKNGSERGTDPRWTAFPDGGRRHGAGRVIRTVTPVAGADAVWACDGAAWGRPLAHVKSSARTRSAPTGRVSRNARAPSYRTSQTVSPGPPRGGRHRAGAVIPTGALIPATAAVRGVLRSRWRTSARRVSRCSVASRGVRAALSPAERSGAWLLPVEPPSVLESDEPDEADDWPSPVRDPSTAVPTA